MDAPKVPDTDQDSVVTRRVPAVVGEIKPGDVVLKVSPLVNDLIARGSNGDTQCPDIKGRKN